MKPSAIAGIVMLVLGLLLLLAGENFGPSSFFYYFWPVMFIMPVGVFFHWMYFQALQRRGIGLLIPGGILLTVSFVCQISMLFDSWKYMWPGFILAPAVGLFEFYWFGNRNRWILLPVIILASLSVLFFFIFSVGYLLQSFSGSQPYIAILLLICGASLLFLNKNKQPRRPY